jgi:restriction system protein
MRRAVYLSSLDIRLPPRLVLRRWLDRSSPGSSAEFLKGDRQMALWVVRAGRQNEYLQKFLETNRIYITWDRLNRDLSAIDDRADLISLLGETYPDVTAGTFRTWAAQLWAFTKTMTPGDWVIVPNKFKRTLDVAEISGDYTHDGSAEDPYFHFREIRWIAQDVPRNVFSQDLLYSIGAFLTIFQVTRNDAENRVRAMASAGWKPERAAAVVEASAEVDSQVDLQQLAQDQIARLISARFKGHGLARLVDAILRAQGYETYLSPEGPDKGIDILAAPGALGFGQPRLCVQVKSGDGPIDHPTLQQLRGAMSSVQAEQGLLVAWGGFKQSVERELPSQFFQVRFWDQRALIEALLEVYEQLDEDVKAELPLKRIWTVTVEDESGALLG